MIFNPLINSGFCGKLSSTVIKDNHRATSQPSQPTNKGATQRTKNRLSNVHQQPLQQESSHEPIIQQLCHTSRHTTVFREEKI